MLVVMAIAFELLSKSQLLPSRFFIGGVSLVILIYLFFKAGRFSGKYIDHRGYVVIAKTKELEHRSIAQQILGRRLLSNEVVHHINGKKTDNNVYNLCLMDRQKHEHFHSWLRWKREKDGRYPSISFQKKTLQSEYRGVLLEKVAPLKKFEPRGPMDRSDLQGKLFSLLREERKRWAQKKNLPAYEIFDDKTLRKMAETMPETESRMLSINGVGQSKIEMYGRAFLDLIKKFKTDHDLDSDNSKDSA